MEYIRNKKIPFEEKSPMEQYEFMIRKQMKSCLLCLEGKELRNKLADHFISQHSDMSDEQLIYFCECPESKELQTKLLTHLMKHIMKKRRRLPKTLPSTTYQSSTFVKDDEMDNRSDDDVRSYGDANNSDDNFEPVTKVETTTRIKRFRTPVIDQNLQCDRCPKTFKSRKCLITHVISHTNYFPCVFPGCQKICKSKVVLAQHKHNIHDRKMCERCSLVIRASKMTEHIRLHDLGGDMNAKTVNCKVEGCKKAFRSYHALRYHNSTAHSTDRPFMCEFCSMSFPTKANLRAHRKKHTDPDRYRCKICQQPFNDNKSYVRHHLRKHPEIELPNQAPRPYKCDYPDCKKDFIRQTQLLDHQQTIHIEGKSTVYRPKKVEVYCSICSKMFIRKYHLDRHMRNVHQIFKTKNQTNENQNLTDPASFI